MLKHLLEIENLRNENGALRRAVDSKSAAIVILRKELEDNQKERDEFHTLSNTHLLPQRIHFIKNESLFPEKLHSALLSGTDKTLVQLLSQSKEENKQLCHDLADFKCKLHDAQSDLKILRAEKERRNGQWQKRMSVSTSSQLAQQERETHLQQLEHLAGKCHTQEGDLRQLLEEHEELVTEREETRQKVRRLNHALSMLLSPDTNGRPGQRALDLDAIINENRYLRQRLKQLDEEKSQALANSSKYKSALENSRAHLTPVRLGSSNNVVLSPRQVSEYLKELGYGRPSEDLKSLCDGLVEALRHKSLKIKSQNAANKMLMDRVHELERRMRVSSSSTDEPLLEEYTSPLDRPTAAAEEAIVSSRLGELEASWRRNEEQEEINKTEDEKECVRAKVNDIEVGHCKANGIEESYGIDNDIKKIHKKNANPEHSCMEVEETIDVQNLDSYLSDLKECEKILPPYLAKTVSPTSPSNCSDNLSANGDFDLSFLSDYDTDDGGLEATLTAWQTECHKATSATVGLKGRKKKDKALAGAFDDILKE